MRGRRNSALAVAFALTTGCAASRLDPLPVVPDQSQAATVTVVRGRGLIAAAISTPLVVDGWTVARLRPGDYIRFQLPTGTHSLGVVSSSVAIPFEAGQQYFFQIAYSARTLAATIERLTPEAAEHELRDARRVQP